jgi:2-phosphoglycolate phosphatase
MIQAILFDLDGTLLDTAPDLVGALNYLRSKEGFPQVQTDDYRHCVSRGALGLITAGMPESSEEVFQRRKTDLLRHYEENLYKETRPFEGVESLLLELDKRAIPWGIVTNKMEYLTIPLLRSANLTKRAGCVICGDTLQYSKPHPAPVLLACELLGVKGSDALMIGDDLRDLQAGQAAGTHTALATYGYLAPGILQQDLQHSYMVDQPGDVLALLKTQSGHF